YTPSCRIVFLFITPPHPGSTLFPYTTLFRSGGPPGFARLREYVASGVDPWGDEEQLSATAKHWRKRQWDLASERSRFGTVLPGLDRKSTRLNSSHVKISYAVFCLKKKKKNQY